MDELRPDKKLDGIAEVRDETDQNWFTNCC